MIAASHTTDTSDGTITIRCSGPDAGWYIYGARGLEILTDEARRAFRRLTGRRVEPLTLSHRQVDAYGDAFIRYRYPLEIHAGWDRTVVVGDVLVEITKGGSWS